MTRQAPDPHSHPRTGEFYSHRDHGDRYPFLFQVLGPIRNLLTGEVHLRLYCLEDATEYLACPLDFADNYVWQGATYTADQLNARRQKWRAMTERPAPAPRRQEGAPV